MKFVDKAFELFESKKPVAVMNRMLIANVLSPECLDTIFSTHRQKQVDSLLSFSTVADMMGEVVLQIQPTVNASYVDREVGVSVNSVYNKLKGIELQVSRALVKETAAKMINISNELQSVAAPLVKGYRAKIVDGNHLRRTDSRIGELRERNVAPLPGHSLVVYDPQYQLAIDVLPCECGHASERTLLPALTETIEVKDLVIADRHFCTIGFLFGIVAAKAKFIIRQHGKLPFALKGRLRRVGEIETGVVYEQMIQCVDESGITKNFRRITVHLYEPTRDGDVEIHIITNLPKRVSAMTVADQYRNRWQIETAFQKMAENLEGEITTLGYPKAALFSFCMALVCYNLLSIIRATVQAVHGDEAADNLSFYYVTNEISSASDGMSAVIENESWYQKYASLTPKQIACELKRVGKFIKLKKFKKHKWTPKNTAKPKMDRSNRQHASTYRILQESRSTA